VDLQRVEGVKRELCECSARVISDADVLGRLTTTDRSNSNIVLAGDLSDSDRPNVNS